MFTYEQIESLNDLELAIYNYVIMHMEKTVHLKIRELAEEVHVSTSTVLRFCNKMDCEGYSEFKIRLKMYLQEHDSLPPQEDLSYIEKFIEDLQNGRYDARLNQAVDLIMDSDEVIFEGVGSSGIIAKYGARFLSDVGCYSIHISDPFHPIPKKDFSKSILIALSVSGQNQQLIEKIKLYKTKNARIITFTNSDNCMIAKMADLAIAYFMPFIKLNYDYNITTQAPLIMLLEAIGHKVQKRMMEDEQMNKHSCHSIR